MKNQTRTSIIEECAKVPSKTSRMDEIGDQQQIIGKTEKEKNDIDNKNNDRKNNNNTYPDSFKSNLEEFADVEAQSEEYTELNNDNNNDVELASTQDISSGSNIENNSVDFRDDKKSNVQSRRSSIQQQGYVSEEKKTQRKQKLIRNMGVIFICIVIITISNVLVTDVFSNPRYKDKILSVLFEEENNNSTNSSNDVNCDGANKIDNGCYYDTKNYTSAESNATISNDSSNSESYKSNTSTNADERNRDQ